MATLILGEFSTPGALMLAARALREEDRGRLDAYTPYPIHGLDEALGLKRSPVPLFALAAAVTGVVVGYGMQWFLNSVDYPLNVGNRPTNSAPLFIPITFEMAVLLTALTIFLGLMLLFGFPRPHHPVFEVEAFKSASTHAFWVSVELPAAAGAPEISERLKALGAAQVAVVEGDR